MTDVCMDLTCTGCGRRYAHRGPVALAGPCPGCGARPPASMLDRLDDILAALAGDCAAMNPARLREARQLAGLSLAQACRLLEVDPHTLWSIEAGAATPTTALTARMNEIYMGQETAPNPIDRHCPPPAWG